jgi:GTP-binding protein
MSRHHIEWHHAAHIESQFPRDGLPQVAFVGRSNVGKSSLLNLLFGHKLAQVSGTPGKTKSLNFYLVDGRFYMVDLPGYGYARRSKEERARFSALIGRFLEHNPSLFAVAHLVDIRHAPSTLDVNISNYLRDLEPAVLTVITKADKLSRGAGDRQRQVIARGLGVETPLLLPFSTVDRRGHTELWSWILDLVGRALSNE